MLIASRVSRIKASLNPHKDSYFLSFEKRGKSYQRDPLRSWESTVPVMRRIHPLFNRIRMKKIRCKESRRFSKKCVNLNAASGAYFPHNLHRHLVAQIRSKKLTKFALLRIIFWYFIEQNQQFDTLTCCRSMYPLKQHPVRMNMELSTSPTLRTCINSRPRTQ